MGQLFGRYRLDMVEPDWIQDVWLVLTTPWVFTLGPCRNHSGNLGRIISWLITGA